MNIHIVQAQRTWILVQNLQLRVLPASAQPRKKRLSLRDANRQYVKREKLKPIINSIEKFCEDIKENTIDVLFFVLNQKLRDTDQEVCAAKISNIWKRCDEKELTAAECLGIRVRMGQSKTKYKQAYNIQKAKIGFPSLAPPKQLTAIEYTYLPEHCSYALVGPDDSCILEHAVQQKDACEPIDIMGKYSQFPSDVPLPSIDGVEFNYISAVAKALEELETKMSAKLNELSLPMDLKVKTFIKDGGDGLGDIKLKNRKSYYSLPDKVFRYSFTILKCKAVVNGVETTLFTEDSCSSVDCSRPILVANCDESDHPSICLALKSISRSRDLLKNCHLLIRDHTGKTVRDHQLVFFYSMVDEKFERTSSGLQGSGSRYLCTLCYATTASCQCDVGSFTRCRSNTETMNFYKCRLENPGNKSENDLDEECRGVKSLPLISCNAVERSVVSTHANINMGRVFKKLLVREIASVFEWTENDQNKTKLQRSVLMGI